MWIYKGSIDGKKIGILLELGKPVMLSHLQMVMLRQLVHPFSWKFPPLWEQTRLSSKFLMQLLQS